MAAEAKATAEAAAAELVVKAAAAVDAAAKDVETLTPTPYTNTSGQKKDAKDAAVAAAAKAVAAAEAAEAAAKSPIVIGKLIAAAAQVKEASTLVLASANKLIEESTDVKKLAAAKLAKEADELAKGALIEANKLTPSTVLPAALKPAAAAAAAASPAAVVPSVKPDKEKAMDLIKSLSDLLTDDDATGTASNKGKPTFAELKQALNKSELIPPAVVEAKAGGGKMHRKKKTGISRRIRRSRVGANTRRSREFY